QAEDGIRHFHVTGVQTCALPISKLALEDAIELNRSIAAHGGDLAAALGHYQDVRSLEVLKIQNAARNSTEWFENVARYANFEPRSEERRVGKEGRTRRPHEQARK